MPYVSDAQRRYMHWAKAHGKIKPKVVEEFDKATPKGAKLPERVKHAAFLDELQKIAWSAAALQNFRSRIANLEGLLPRTTTAWERAQYTAKNLGSTFTTAPKKKPSISSSEMTSDEESMAPPG